VLVGRLTVDELLKFLESGGFRFIASEAGFKVQGVGDMI